MHHMGSYVRGVSEGWVAVQRRVLPGDMLIYDTRLFHAGGANTCATAAGDDDEDAKRRVLLMFSLLAPNPQTGRVDFTGSYVNLAPELDREGNVIAGVHPWTHGECRGPAAQMFPPLKRRLRLAELNGAHWQPAWLPEQRAPPCP